MLAQMITQIKSQASKWEKISKINMLITMLMDTGTIKNITSKREIIYYNNSSEWMCIYTNHILDHFGALKTFVCPNAPTF